MFRQQARGTQVWDPVSGTPRHVNMQPQDSSQLVMPQPWTDQLCFIVFRTRRRCSLRRNNLGKGNYSPLINYTAAGLQVLEAGEFELISARGKRKFRPAVTTTAIDGPWKIKFPRNWGAPDSAAMFDKLISWTESGDQGIKYFSGTATYSKTFRYSALSASSGEKVNLDLGTVHHWRGWLNGDGLGITWAMPFRFDVTGLLHQGDNKLVVEVANAWANRIVANDGSR